MDFAFDTILRTKVWQLKHSRKEAFGQATETVAQWSA
jgi:hypothetical protein